MKQFKKKELLAIIETLVEANDYIEKNRKSNSEILIDILSQCQEAAINIGNCIESHGKIGEPLVRVLEDYCENLYQMSQNLQDEEQIGKVAKKIRKQLSILKDDITYEIPTDKIEIVFLPYKSSMWDSMESVWKAASEDKTCEVRVIPIPYFDKNPNGTLGTMHYEGEQYPVSVPITSWEEYNFSEHRPDIIYIHNPYDECNFVTSVHPTFYAKELKKYTDMLVYIPYFVSSNDKVGEHFCVLPGTLYADRVIVQSEKIRSIYIEEIHKFENAHQCKGRFGNVEEKFLALGSPKYDKVLSLRREEIEIPEEWEYMIND